MIAGGFQVHVRGYRMHGRVSDIASGGGNSVHVIAESGLQFRQRNLDRRRRDHIHRMLMLIDQNLLASRCEDEGAPFDDVFTLMGEGTSKLRIAPVLWLGKTDWDIGPFDQTCRSSCPAAGLA